MVGKSEQLESKIRALTRPLNGQYPRPWMTSLSNPIDCDLFTVGKNQRNGFDVDAVGSHDHFIDCLFNRGNETCRGLYDRLVARASPTRRNTDRLVELLRNEGISGVLETNVICYSTPMSADLRRDTHTHGAERGSEIFASLFKIISPKVIIAHGSDTARKLGKFMGVELPAPPKGPGEPRFWNVNGTGVFVIPSLAPPQFNTWAKWSNEHLRQVSVQAAEFLEGH